MPKLKSAAPDSRMNAERALEVAIVMVNEGYASTALGPLEVFHAAGNLWDVLTGGEGHARFRVTPVTVNGKRVSSPYGVSLISIACIDDIPHADIVIVPSLGLDYDGQLARNAKLMPWLRARYKRGSYVAGVCTGALFLAEAKLLDGRRATTHWAVADEFARRYPKVKWQSEAFITEDNRLLCSGGVYAAIDLSLYLVEKLCGHEIALKCAKALLVDMPRSSQTAYAVLPLSRPHADDRIRDVETFMSQNCAENLRVEGLADRAGMSSRNFIRRFKAATGQVPGHYLQALRITAAKRMLEDGARNIQTVSFAVGYEDIAFFRSLFKRYTGLNPGEYRSRFGPRTSVEGSEPKAKRGAVGGGRG